MSQQSSCEHGVRGAPKLGQGEQNGCSRNSGRMEGEIKMEATELGRCGTGHVLLENPLP